MSCSPTNASSPSSITRPANAAERSAMQGLRTLLPSIVNLPDSTLVRWYRSKQCKFDETAEALRKHVIFRKAWHLDHLDEYEPSEILEKYCGYGLLPDKEGNPILMSLLGNMDVEGMLRSVQSRQYIQFSLAAIEKGVELCNQRALKTGRAFEQMLLVFDLDHITAAHCNCKAFAATFITLIMLFQEHYPLSLKKILIIRGPELARFAYNMLTPFLSDNIDSLIEMPDDWIGELMKWVDIDAWPVAWGGRFVDDSGDPHCPSKIRYGLGPVPDSYFVKPEEAMPDYDHLTTVYAGDKHLIELKATAKTRLSWQYMTQEEDIGFAIYFDKTQYANSLSEMDIVFPYIRLECSQVPVTGQWICEHAGRYIIEFDNYYSWFSAKELRYNIDIDEP